MLRFIMTTRAALPHLEAPACHVDVGSARPVERARVHDVVRADDDTGERRCRRVLVDLVHLPSRGRRRRRASAEEHAALHVPRQAAGDGVDGIAYLRPALLQQRRQLLHRVLRLGDRHAVPRHDDDAAGRREQLRHLLGRRLLHRTGGRHLPARRRGRRRAEAAEDDAHERAVHRLLHRSARTALATARRRQARPSTMSRSSRALRERRRQHGPARGQLFEHRDDDGHVPAADGEDEVRPEDAADRPSCERGGTSPSRGGGAEEGRPRSDRPGATASKALSRWRPEQQAACRRWSARRLAELRRRSR